MLNAFRHHRVLRKTGPRKSTIVDECSTPFGITGCYAKQQQTIVAACMGAQRLSASQGATRCPYGLMFPARLVLNAFRHHRVLRTVDAQSFHFLLCAQRLSASQGATQSRLASRPRLPIVLNAFRHHRVLRPEGSAILADHNLCSTPFGITGCYAQNDSRGHPAVQVLNAFRHHRVLRDAGGIEGNSDSGAQRLSASQGATRLRISRELV